MGKYLPHLVWLLPIIMLLELSIRPLFEPDLFFYFALIERFLQSWSWPVNDPFVYTLPSDPVMTMHQWLGYWTLYVPYLWLGWAGPILLKTTLAFLFFSLPLVALIFHRQTVSSLFPLAWSIAIFAGHHRIRERVSLWGDLFALGLCAGLLWSSQKRWFWRSLPFLFLLWAQVHPSYPLGFVILAIYLACDWATAKTMGAWKWILASVASAMIHPLGWQGFIYPFIFSLNVEPYLSRNIMEWLPLWDARIFPYTFLYVPLFTLVPWLFWRHFRCPQPHRLLPFAFLALATALMLKSVRFGMLAQGIFLLILMHQEIIAPSRTRRFVNWVATLACAALVGVKVFASPWLDRPLHERIELDPVRLPLEAARILKDQNPRMRLFNSFAYGGYLAWLWQGQPPLFFHGFSTNFDFFEKYYLAPMESQTRLMELIQKFDIGIFLLTKTGYDGDYINLLSMNPHWQKMYEDAGSVIFIKKDPRVFDKK